MDSFTAPVSVRLLGRQIPGVVAHVDEDMGNDEA